MIEESTLTQRMLEQAIEQTANHRAMLADIATRLAPFAPEICQEWSPIYRDAHKSDSPEAEDSNLGIQNVVELFYGGLKAGTLREYFSAIEAWGGGMLRSGLSYDRVVSLLREYQRGTIPFLLRVYSPGPELESAFSSLDQLYTAIGMLLAAIFVESSMGPLGQSAHSHALEQLATGASHELENILAAIAGRAQLLSEHTSDFESQDELDAIRRAAGLGAETSRRLQEFARNNENQTIARLDVNRLMADAADMTRLAWREQAETNGIIIDMVKDFADVPPVNARPSELRAVFIELLLHAVAALPQGGLIALRTERKGDQVFASVQHGGTGEATRSGIADAAFATGSAPPPRLGIANAAKIIQQYGGALTGADDGGRGSIFTVSLPVAPELEEGVAQALAPEHSLKILLIDDDPMERSLVKKFLVHRGYQVDLAEDSAEGLALVQRNSYDLVLADLGMPEMSGWQVAKKITQLYPKLLVVLMSYWDVELDQAKVKASGAHRIVHKPLELDQVLRVVEEAALLKDKI